MMFSDPKTSLNHRRTSSGSKLISDLQSLKRNRSGSLRSLAIHTNSKFTKTRAKPRSHQPSPSTNDLKHFLQKKVVQPCVLSRMIMRRSSAEQTKTIKNVISRCVYKTRVGMSKGRPKKNNQDSLVIKPSFCDTKGQYLFGVCDGHGNYGHLISNFIKEKLPIKVAEAYLPSDDLVKAMKLALKQGIEQTIASLEQSEIDLSFSGSTLICVLVVGDTLVCANIGDSRAILGTLNDLGWQRVSMSRDHKPELDKETKRILNSGGRIAKYQDALGQESGPMRVWLRDQDIPGLAMSRSIGDNIAKQAGVVDSPEFKWLTLARNDKFIVLASDGLWEVITNEECVKIVGELYNLGNTEVCCENLVKKALSRWKRQSEVVDDITVIVLFLNT